MYAHALKGPDAARFLKHLLRHTPGSLLVVWDGAPIHRSQPVKELLANKMGQRLWLERLPAYAPELNPNEGVWAHLKCVELKNLACDDMLHLRRELRRALERLRKKPAVIMGCFAESGRLV
jgi:transposase